MRVYQQRLDAFDQQALNGLARTYKEIQPDFQGAMATLQDKIRAAAASGLQPSASWVMQLERYRTLEQQVLASTARLGIMTGQYAEGEAAKALEAQNDFFKRLATGQASYGGTGDIRTWATLPERTLTSFMGLSAGNPLLTKFAAEAGRDAMRAMRTTLASGIATGRPMRQTAKLMAARVAGLTLTRAQTITRTEVARARRAAALQTFQMNPAVRGWVWRAALDRSCPACIALHGREFPTSEMQAGHPNCRCVMVPMRHRGVNPDVGTGGQWLATKSPNEWQQILGKGRAEWLAADAARGVATAGGRWSLVTALDKSLQKVVTYVPNRGYGGMYRPTTLRALTGRPAGPTLPPPSAIGQPVRPNISQAMRDRQAQQWQAALQQYKPAGMTDEAFTLQVREHVRRELALGETSTRRSVRSARNIIQEGRFKSQFETGRSGGALTPSGRADIENRMFEYPLPSTINRRVFDMTHDDFNKAFPGEKRPIYGYVNDPRTDVDGAEWYGDVRFVMKSEVRQKSTITNGDSLGGAFSPTHFDDDNLEYLTLGSYNSPLNWKIGANGYTEVQYHGGLFLEDVAEVVLPRATRIGTSTMGSRSDFDEIIRLLEDRKIPWRYEADRTGFASS